MAGNINYTGDATASFSGYLYQADVALLVALEKIKEIGIDNIDELKQWSLEVEGEEDFTIAKKDENNNFIEKHLYQVKEYEDINISKYIDGTIKLFQCTIHGNNKNIDCYSYICGKKELGGIKDLLINNVIATKSIDNLFQKSFCDIGIFQLECRVWRYYFKKGKEKTKSIIKNWYSSDTEEHKKRKKEINTNFEAKIKQDNEKFKTNFSIGRKEGYGDFSKMHLKIKALISNLSKENAKDKLDFFNNQSDNYLRYFESKIKRMIQDNKKKDIGDRKPLNLYENILKEILEKDMFSLDKEDYQDMFLCNFIEKFNEEFIKLYDIANEELIQEICVDLGNDKEKLYDFLKEVQSIISDYILDSSKDKLLLFMSYTLSEDIKLPVNIKEYSKSTYNFLRIKNKILLLVSYFYAKRNCGDLKDDFFNSDGNNYIIENDLYKGILTGLHLGIKSDIKDFVNSHSFFEYENTHIGIFGENKVTLGDYLSSNSPQYCFFEQNKTTEHHNKLNKSITNTKKIKIFGGQNFLSTDVHNYLN